MQRALTWSPLSTRYVHRCEPTKPAPPVTSTLFLSILGFVLMMVLSPCWTTTFCTGMRMTLRCRAPLPTAAVRGMGDR